MDNILLQLENWLLGRISLTSACMCSNKKNVNVHFKGEQEAYIDCLNKMNELKQESEVKTDEK